MSLALQVDSLPLGHPGSPLFWGGNNSITSVPIYGNVFVCQLLPGLNFMMSRWSMFKIEVQEGMWLARPISGPGRLWTCAVSVSFSSFAVHLDCVDVWAPLLVPCARGHISECCIQAKNREGWAETSPAGFSFSSWWCPSSLPPFLYRGRGVSGTVRGEFSERPGLCEQLLLQQQQQKKQSLNSE